MHAPEGVSEGSGPEEWPEDARILANGHVVQFYRDEASLLRTLTEFVAGGLEQGDAVVVLATPAHREALERSLTARGVPASQRAPAGRLQLRDAAATLALFMNDGVPDAGRFQELVAPIIEGARAASATGKVRAFGEMVDLLWRAKNEAALLRLEELWNDVARQRQLTLLCAYSLELLKGARDRPIFDRICERHAHAIPVEQPGVDEPSGRLTAHAKLEQRELVLEDLLGSERAARRGAEQSADQLRRLLKVTASLSRAATVEEIAQVVVTEGVWATGASTGGLWLTAEDGAHARLVYDLGYPEEGRQYFRLVPLAGALPMPLVDCLRDGEAVWVESRAKLQARYPALAGLDTMQADQAIACLPIVASRRPVGALSFTFDSTADIDQTQRDFLLTIAYQSEVALERARLFERERAGREEAEAAQRRASFKAEASAVLASSLDYAITLRNVAQLAIPRFAEGCVVELRDDAGATSVVAVEHVDPAKVDLVRKLRETGPSHGQPLLDSATVLRTGAAVLRADLGGDLLALQAKDATGLALARALALRSAITVPMLVHGRTIGVMSFIRAESSRRYNDADLETAVMLGQRAAFAVDNARLHGDLQRAVVARDDLIGVVSHDLRNLLGVMTMSAQGMMKKIPEGPEGEKAQRLLGAMKRTTARMNRLIHDLLDFGGIESGRLKVDPRPEDLNTFFAPLLEDLRPLAAAKGIRLRGEPPGRALTVLCDRQRVFQVLSNLVGNAIKFTPSEGTIVVEARAGGDGAIFAVHDTGIGIDAAHLPKIFDRYYQGDGRDGGGVGLGLFISRGIVEAHGGRIWVESAPGTGSHFFFTLPRLADDAVSTDAAE